MAPLHGVSVAKLACAPIPPKITRVPNHMKYLNIEPHNVQAIVWWLAATLGCSVPKWLLMGMGPTICVLWQNPHFFLMQHCGHACKI